MPESAVRPRLFRVRRTFPGEPIADLGAAVAQALADLRLAERVQPGARIAVTSGSRGVANIVAVTAAVVAELRRLGAEPWILPCMGSHGGATAAGQLAVLESYGITEANVGAPVISQERVVPLGHSDGGVPLFADALAAESDGLLVINRVKPHTDFTGLLESGPNKMLAIGLGKWHSAATCHSWFVERGYDAVLRDVGDALWSRLPLLGGLGLVENGHHHTVALGAVRPASHEADEAALLDTARKVFGYLPFDKLDILLVDQIGKDISGAGMDPNVTGADGCKLHGRRESPFIWRICVRGLTAATHGNATGIGNADYVLQRCVDAIDWHATWTNADTAASPEGARCPVTWPHDAAMLAAALRTSGHGPAEQKRLVWVRDTLAVDEFLVSEALLDEVRATPGCTVCGEQHDALATDSAGFFTAPW